MSIRQLAATRTRAREKGGVGAATWLSELIWRDFYAQILCTTRTSSTHAFKAEYRRPRVSATTRRCSPPGAKARTGYPLVDAAMRQINQTGYMHNRLRMVAASSW